MRKLSLIAVLSVAVPVQAMSPGRQEIDRQEIGRIVSTAYSRGEVMDIAEHLSDVIGARLPNSPAMREAEAWTQQKFREWGLQNVHKEGFEFGRGWWIESASVRMTAPRALQLRAIPIAWTPPTDGTLTAPIIVAPMTHEEDFAQWRGKLAGKIVLISAPEPPKDATAPAFGRFTEDELAKLDVYRPTLEGYDPERTRRHVFRNRIDSFLKAEGAVAWARMSYRDGGLVHGEGYGYRLGRTPSLPAFEIGAEDYRRLARLAVTGPVTLALESRVHFEDRDTQAYNIIADIPGRDPKAGYVMAGGHLDSWVAGDGAADNGAGTAVIMEAARILRSLNVRPKRTIRFALWNAEEEGLYGSSAYVTRYIATRPEYTDPGLAGLPVGGWGPLTYPITPLPGYRDMKAYFNLDYGSGRIRGIYAENNLAVAPIFQDWLAPFHSLGATTVAAPPIGGTDHLLMSMAGLPAFQFIQDPLDYFSTTHHSNVDTFDHLRGDDLRQAAAIVAAFLLMAAEREEPLPGTDIPTRPEQ